MCLVLQISDTHFGTEITPVVEALHALVRAQDPTLIVWSGDITQRARRAQFAAAARFASELRGSAARPLLVIPGNHDIALFDLRARLRDPYGNYTRAFGDTLEPCYESDELLVQGLNTTRFWRHKHGEVSEEQIARVAQRLRDARRKQLRIVVTHQPFQAIRDSDINNLVRGHERAARIWSEAGADVFMGGHIHLPYVRELRSELRALAHRTWVVQAGTAVSRRIRESVPNSVNFIRYAADAERSCSVERWDYALGSGEFHPVQVHTLALTRVTELAESAVRHR
jgi:3',5'-cyclic AMP phosphodiesterase CpdA